MTYNDTKMTLFVAGERDTSLAVVAYACATVGCKGIDEVVDDRSGTLRWSDNATWTASVPKPTAGSNVRGWGGVGSNFRGWEEGWHLWGECCRRRRV